MRGGDSLFHNMVTERSAMFAKTAGVDDPTAYYGLTTIWADFNNHRATGYYVANDSTAGFLYRQRWKGQIHDIGLDPVPALARTGTSRPGLAWRLGDYLHTGRPSLVVTNLRWITARLSQRREVGFSGCLVFVGDWTAFGAVCEVGSGVRGSGQRWVARPDYGERPRVSAGDTLHTGARYREPKLVQYNQGDGHVLRRERAIRRGDYGAACFAGTCQSAISSTTAIWIGGGRSAGQARCCCEIPGCRGGTGQASNLAGTKSTGWRSARGLKIVVRWHDADGRDS